MKGRKMAQKGKKNRTDGKKGSDKKGGRWRERKEKESIIQKSFLTGNRSRNPSTELE